MQTFLPYSDFNKTAEVLDNKRLGNQCYRETKTLIEGKWANHPASKMWKGSEYWLALYGLALIAEMGKRKVWGVDVIKRWVDYYNNQLNFHSKNKEYPFWLGDENFHASHRSNLLRKDPIWYSKFGWTESNNLPYIWPV